MDSKQNLVTESLIFVCTKHRTRAQPACVMLKSSFRIIFLCNAYNSNSTHQTLIGPGLFKQPHSVSPSTTPSITQIFTFAKPLASSAKTLNQTLSKSLAKLDNQTGTYCITHGTHSVLRGILDGRGVWRRMDTCMCMAESLCCPLETITTLLLGYKFKSLAQLCPTLCDPVDCSPPGSSVHGILQARILEWVAISFSKGSS